MRLDYLHDGKLHSVDLSERAPGRWHARWSVREASDGVEGEILREAELELDVRLVDGSAWSVLAGDEVHDLSVEREGSSRRITSPAGRVELEYLDPHRPRSGPGGAATSGRAQVSSPMPGRVVEVKVEVGEEVEEGQTVVVVEAMKMANEYRSPIRGRVSLIHVGAGDAVDGGAALLVIEAEDS